MNLASVATAAIPAPSGRPTQTELAAANMTPKSRTLLPDALLDAKIGKSTLAGALNDQIRFRVDRTGSSKEWKLVPDSPLAAAVVASKAGEGLLRQLYMGIRSTGNLEEVSNLKGIILAEDNESVAAGQVMAWLDNPEDPDGRQLARLGELGQTKVAGRIMRKWDDGLPNRIAVAGAWNSEGWITYMPDIARATLIAAGAYDPHASREKKIMRASAMTEYLTRVHPHEIQHSVSDPTRTAYVGDARWMEEGTADVMAYTPVFHSKNRRDAQLTPQKYASKLSHKPYIDIDWDPYKRPTLPAAEKAKNDKDAQRNYGGGQKTLTDLVKLAGANFNTPAGRAEVFELLQRKSMRYTAGVLAKAIIAEHDLDPKVYDKLRERISGAVDVEGGARTIAREFGIDS